MAPKMRTSVDMAGISARILNILSYINQIFRENIYLRDLSLISGMNRFYLEKIFKQEIGIPIKKFIILKRLCAAARMLRSSQKTSVTSACFDVGFGDLSNFARKFRKYFGCSPIEYKICHKDPSQCELRNRSFIHLLGDKNTLIRKALNADICALCYEGKTIIAAK